MLWTFAKRHIRKLRPLTRPYTTVDRIELVGGPVRRYMPGQIHYWTHDGHEITSHEFDVLMEEWNKRNK